MRLQVAVNNPQLMSRIERVTNLLRDVERAGQLGDVERLEPGLVGELTLARRPARPVEAEAVPGREPARA